MASGSESDMRWECTGREQGEEVLVADFKFRLCFEHRR